ncbi:MAG: nucleotide pyrophosphohydrolase [Candidatus Brocadiaceae bacterium]|nr:nucleotide pyrophosphohydrolase [Candidatus Brocadiaceae bacterium]
MEIDTFQKLIEETYSKKDSRRGLSKTFMWFTEEVGELSRAMRDGTKEELEKEFADVLAWLFSLASLSEVKMEEAIRKYTEGCPVCKEIPCSCLEKS